MLIGVRARVEPQEKLCPLWLGRLSPQPNAMTPRAKTYRHCECHLREDICEGGGPKEFPQVCVEAPKVCCSRCPMATTMDVHPLAYPWTFTYFKKVANKSYEENTFTLGTTETVEDFWRLYVHLRRPVDERPTVCDYHVFREGIRPMWEDDANKDGGKWIVRLKKGLVARFWEDIVRKAHCAHAAPLRRTRHEKGAHPDLPVALCAAIGHPRRPVPRGRRDLRLRPLDSLPRGHPLRLEQIRRLAPRLHADPRHDALRHVPA